MLAIGKRKIAIAVETKYQDTVLRKHCRNHNIEVAQPLEEYPFYYGIVSSDLKDYLIPVATLEGVISSGFTVITQRHFITELDNLEKESKNK